MGSGERQQRSGIGARWARGEHADDVVDADDRRVLGDRHLLAVGAEGELVLAVGEGQHPQLLSGRRAPHSDRAVQGLRHHL